MAGRGHEASARIVRQLRDALAALLDQRTPFGRLALTQVVLTAGDTLLTVSLASSLFFKVSPDEARGKVILYLLLTMAPFAVVAPLLGPIIDRSRGARRATVVVSSACRAAICLVLAGDLGSLLLFPEAFAMLVLSKVYLVTKGSLVPLVVGASERPGGNELASANARLGLLSSLASLVASIPAIGVLELLGGAWVLRLDMVVFLVGTVVALRLPVGRRARRSWGDAPAAAPAPAAEPAVAARPQEAWDEETPRGALGPRVNTHPEVLLALSAMSVLRGLVGFVTFLLAFSLDRMKSAKGWYGFMLGASVAGALVGVMLVPRARKVLTEPQMITLSIWSVALAGALTALVGGIVIQAFLAFVIGLASAASKPAFDALVQRYVPTAAQGRAFARFETRLQLIWVLGALLPVVVSLPLGSGDVVISAVAAVTGLSYLTSRSALRHRWVTP
ncbi:MAG: MFS transporter [Acidimicrobiales bacterium]|nr:MFS transporter [Acidimicrobiales bacterium]